MNIEVGRSMGIMAMNMVANIPKFRLWPLLIGAVVVAGVIHLITLKHAKVKMANDAKEDARKEKAENTSLLIVDAQNDFIDGAVACENSMEAIDNILKYIKANPEIKTFYTANEHPENYIGFTINGGNEPVHVVKDTDGAEIFLSFKNLENPKQRAVEENTYYKGTKENTKEYSALGAINRKGDPLNEMLRSNVVLCGFVSEECIKETAMTLVESGYKVELLSDGLGYKTFDSHIDTILDLENLGVRLI
ncbi:MAG: isochorismatase family protein [Tissierellia bacterium]|nr:isochorismatase family protein [Tissierellia bacterium]